MALGDPAENGDPVKTEVDQWQVHERGIPRGMVGQGFGPLIDAAWAAWERAAVLRTPLRELAEAQIELSSKRAFERVFSLLDATSAR